MRSERCSRFEGALQDNTTCPDIPEGQDCTTVRLDVYKVGKRHLQKRMHVPRVKKSGGTHSRKVDAIDP